MATSSHNNKKSAQIECFFIVLFWRAKYAIKMIACKHYNNDFNPFLIYHIVYESVLS